MTDIQQIKGLGEFRPSAAIYYGAPNQNLPKLPSFSVPPELQELKNLATQETKKETNPKKTQTKPAVTKREQLLEKLRNKKNALSEARKNMTSLETQNRVVEQKDITQVPINADDKQEMKNQLRDMQSHMKNLMGLVKEDKESAKKEETMNELERAKSQHERMKRQQLGLKQAMNSMQKQIGKLSKKERKLVLQQTQARCPDIAKDYVKDVMNIGGTPSKHSQMEEIMFSDPNVDSGNNIHSHVVKQNSAGIRDTLKELHRTDVHTLKKEVKEASLKAVDVELPERAPVCLKEEDDEEEGKRDQSCVKKEEGPKPPIVDNPRGQSPRPNPCDKKELSRKEKKRAKRKAKKANTSVSVVTK